MTIEILVQTLKSWQELPPAQLAQLHPGHPLRQPHHLLLGLFSSFLGQQFNGEQFNVEQFNGNN